jgi:hypothetical protein
MSVPLTQTGWKIFETEAETVADCETEAETDADGMRHIGVSPALCLCAYFQDRKRRPTLSEPP